MIMSIISSKVTFGTKLRFSRFLELAPMSHASRSAHIADLIDDFTDGIPRVVLSGSPVGVFVPPEGREEPISNPRPQQKV